MIWVLVITNLMTKEARSTPPPDTNAAANTYFVLDAPRRAAYNESAVKPRAQHEEAAKAADNEKGVKA